MTTELTPRRFRMETSTVFVVVALIAVAYFQQQRMQPADAQIMVFYSGYIVVSALLGYYFARWYVVPDTSWFETISVPIVITLIALLAACLLLLILEAISGRVSDPYASFLGMMLLATKVLVIIGPISAVIGIGVSIALHFRARAARCVEPNKTIEPTR